ncbi:D-alanyl-D-alanine carboxypeptidase/D-alanyl-D-alanine-endopeptidase [Chromobacterium aquaticum]|uniref:D-alanyl-D-alanine carboxypeptidase/D-alanyl-D-alanine-endopeptidase n=1 Tax=Chromobacterium aquaticum TaxID=467180 RepID=A0ABV8ZW87_9NEIS|nr:D-alanyl-D-alanine carboxypeptidase/D-alanyl-D-alanine-endopeptidase [Chromobacterium aquaticum]MCD5360834.1 D-alanyl-D-alanine carboxypeptidase/D-alanyl-D-alanine-endopeptidase [Chromobacterium aquaticum]
MNATLKKTLLAGCLLLAAWPAFAMDLHGLKPEEVAVWAAPVESGKTLAGHRADSAVNPASTMKLITSWSALNLLKPGYHWHTGLWSAAPLRDGALQGDLYWLGAGDPRFNNDSLLKLLYELRLRGVKQIDGRLLLDKSAFKGISSAHDFDEDLGRAFTVEPDSHLTNLKVAWLNFYVDAAGARVALDPPLAGVRVNAKLQAGGQGGPNDCSDVRRYATISNDANSVTVSGTLPASCDGAKTFVNVLDHDAFASQDFAALWQALGGAGPKGAGQGRVPAGARELAGHDSQPLTVAISDINKYSNNTMARTLFLTLGKEGGGEDTRANAEHAVRRLLAANGISDETLVLENGSGLSRRERVSARLMGQVLLNAARGPYASEFLASLPIAGEDGTLKKRFADQGPRLRMKTGTLKDVKALAGYWLGADGRRLALAVIVNSPRAPEMGKAMDQIVADLIDQFEAAK